jgi:hypothetical protein
MLRKSPSGKGGTGIPEAGTAIMEDELKETARNILRSLISVNIFTE